MKKFKKLLLASLAFATLIGGVASFRQVAQADSNPSSVAAIKKRGTLRVAVFGDLKPYGWVDKDGKRTGFDVEIARQFAKDLGVKPKFVQVNANNRVDALSSDKVDVVLANFTVTDERKQVVDFAKPYMKVSVGVLSKKNDKVTKTSQLKGQKLIVNKGTTAETYFTQNASKLGVDLLKFDSKTQQFNALKNGRADVLADDNTYLYTWAKNNPDYVVGIKELGPQSYISPAVKKDNKDLLKWTNKEIAKLDKDGFLDQTYKSQLAPYFTKDVKASDVLVK
ncbi:transporter substrate-binding domain-containing protein [Ligilactobacillus equi]|uniref:ABC transporter substrate-binding protein n=1 Tax=Ligilactobacillus equi DSM 15833 = JCM 10991 TaxID=1423740 RepID=A0A0R1TVG8_9LACO|nr:transporter substrate-binding domain-containing protein [Ligilactobacillus equi]KRL83002.1 ABC transporter substrate-binding protein [Ligilactobacillus equi DSM 15833 = JCM 10991]